MIDEKLVAPLSPPNSPRMSDKAAKTEGNQWQQLRTAAFDANVTSQPQAPGFSQLPRDPQTVEDQKRPSLRSHKSFPYSLGPSSRLAHNSSQGVSGGSGLRDFDERLISQGPQPGGTSDLPPATFGGSAPTSPASRLTPHSPGAGPSDEQVDEDELDFAMGDPEEEEDGKVPMTAAELRAQKRKMKRFRLTHNQTRFLMSEFARQAHPDAAHRERLSREIPGLSPRQVQVWFQNRRAKLKRLTTDDRERMMRSRALPADFDMTQALHSPFGAGPTMGTPMPSPGAYAPFGDSGGVRPLTLDTLRRVPEYDLHAAQYTSPTGISPALGAFAFTPPQSATDTMSPTSAASDMSAYGFPHRGAQESPRRHPFGGPLGGPTGFAAHHQHAPRLHLHDRFSRPMPESVGSPLRSSMSYSGPPSGGLPSNHPPERSASFAAQSSFVPERGHQQRSMTSPGGPYGLGFTYNYQTTVTGQQSSPVTTTSQTIEVQQYRRDSSHLAGRPIGTYAGYQGSNFGTAQVPQYPNFSAPFPGPLSSFESPYQHQQGFEQHQSPQQHNFAPLPSQPHHFVPLGSSADNEEPNDDGDNSDGGVPIPPSY